MSSVLGITPARGWAVASVAVALLGASMVVGAVSGAADTSPALPGRSPAGSLVAGATTGPGRASNPGFPPGWRSPGPDRTPGLSGRLPDRAAPAADQVEPLPAATPVALSIAAIGVRTPLSTLGLTSAGLIAVPPATRAAPAGWYRYSSTPGEVGPAVIVGHVDSARDGPAVFYRLGELVPGDQVEIRRVDGSVAIFTVDRTEMFRKQQFPAGAVYGQLAWPGLRLITCGGSFDHLRGHYRSNLVVFASLTRSIVAPADRGGSRPRAGAHRRPLL